MKFVLNAMLNTYNDGIVDFSEEFEAKDWGDAEIKAEEIYLSNDGEYKCSFYSVTNLTTKEEKEYDMELYISQEKLNRINGILANVIPDVFDEV